MKKDLNYIAALEKAITEKYGEQAIVNPKSLWDTEKEKEYIEQVKLVYKNERKEEKTEIDGILVTKKLLNKTENRRCQTCNTYSFNRDNDIFLTKYEVCKRCFIKYIEGREERWKEGWRPNTEKQNGT
jgi:hypothetical protein